ncbi:MAG TPA: nitrile hydratase [bacterium]|nr:nitrile hydratase [bacterium]
MADAPPHGVHDVGGLPGDEPVDREEHEPHAFEKRVGALLRLLSHPDKRVMRVDELRRGIESLNETEYAGYAYYERWVESIRRILVEKGLLDEAELQRKIAEVQARFGEGGGGH